MFVTQELNTVSSSLLMFGTQELNTVTSSLLMFGTQEFDVQVGAFTASLTSKKNTFKASHFQVFLKTFVLH